MIHDVVERVGLWENIRELAVLWLDSQMRPMSDKKFAKQELEHFSAIEQRTDKIIPKDTMYEMLYNLANTMISDEDKKNKLVAYLIKNAERFSLYDELAKPAGFGSAPFLLYHQ